MNVVCFEWPVVNRSVMKRNRSSYLGALTISWKICLPFDQHTADCIRHKRRRNTIVCTSGFDSARILARIYVKQLGPGFVVFYMATTKCNALARP